LKGKFGLFIFFAVKKLHESINLRGGISLETIDSWTNQDVATAVKATNPSLAISLCPQIEAHNIDGHYLLHATDAEFDQALSKMILDDDCLHWVLKSRSRIQKRQSIVGRTSRLGPLPESWEIVHSRSRSGEVG
jgi:hypothetical protein